MPTSDEGLLRLGELRQPRHVSLAVASHVLLHDIRVVAVAVNGVGEPANQELLRALRRLHVRQVAGVLGGHEVTVEVDANPAWGRVRTRDTSSTIK